MDDLQREEVARILEQIASEGLPHPRDLDVALDAIDQIVSFKHPAQGGEAKS